MSRHAQENLVSVLLLVLFAGVIVLCLDFGPREIGRASCRERV